VNSPHVSFFRRCLGTATAILGGLAVLHFTAAGGLPRLAADLRDCHARNAELAENERAGEELDEQLVLTAARTEYRLGLLDELVAKRLTLRVACGEFRRFIGSDSRFDRTLLAIAGGSDDTERLANYLLTSLVKAGPVDAGTRSRLADEFRHEFGQPPEFVAPPDGSLLHGNASAGAAPLHLAPESAHCP